MDALGGEKAEEGMQIFLYARTGISNAIRTRFCGSMEPESLRYEEKKKFLYFLIKAGIFCVQVVVVLCFAI